MPSTKKVTKKNELREEASPTARRPHSPGRAYGVPRGKKSLLPWSHVSERMDQAKYYWVCTVGPANEPHATPVDGLWLDDRLYFGGDPETRRNRNLAANPAACIHLESGVEVVILHGVAHELRDAGEALAIRLAAASAQKYGYPPEPAVYMSGTGIYVFRPRVVFAWQDLLKDVTRWDFPPDA